MPSGMKKLSLIIIFISAPLASQSLQMNVGKDSLSYIDYEKDKKWITKVEKYKLSNSERMSARVNVKANFDYANSISDLTINYNDVIDSYIDKYSSYRWLPRIYGLLGFYEPLFEAKLREYGLPSDLKYLAIVESNMNPQAGSWVGASGLWQFMPATGAAYGLAKNAKVNLFYDPYMATDAACRYLKKLYGMFGEWNLVLSAYNSGEGRVMGAIRKAGTKHYWTVRNYLPAETKAYAPSFHAVRFIAKMYGLYYSTKPKFKYDYSQVREVMVNNSTSFYSFAQNIGTNLELLYFLNPHIVTEEIPRNTFVYFIK